MFHFPFPLFVLDTWLPEPRKEPGSLASLLQNMCCCAHARHRALRGIVPCAASCSARHRVLRGLTVRPFIYAGLHA